MATKLASMINCGKSFIHFTRNVNTVHFCKNLNLFLEHVTQVESLLETVLKTVENFHIDNCTIEINKFFLLLLVLVVVVVVVLLILFFYFRQREVVANRPYSIY